LVTVQISKKRFAGIVALAIVLQSENFLIYDTTITYPIFWTMFYLLSIYLLFKSSFLSPISYAASVLSHPIAAAFLPITIIAVVLFDFPKRQNPIWSISHIS